MYIFELCQINVNLFFQECINKMNPSYPKIKYINEMYPPLPYRLPPRSSIYLYLI